MVISLQRVSFISQSRLPFGSSIAILWLSQAAEIQRRVKFSEMLPVPQAVGLTYFQFHCYFTIPATFVLWFVARPFLDLTQWINAALVTFIAVVYTTPWDNFLIWTNTWNFPEDAIWGRIGFVPVEEYFFFAIQTAMVYIWSVLCLRWTLPSLKLAQPSAFTANLIRWLPVMFFLGASVWAWSNLGGNINNLFLKSKNFKSYVQNFGIMNSTRSTKILFELYSRLGLPGTCLHLDRSRKFHLPAKSWSNFGHFSSISIPEWCRFCRNS